MKTRITLKKFLTVKTPKKCDMEYHAILWYINWNSSICININPLLYPLIRNGNVITYVDVIFIQTISYERMYETLEEYHKILQKENLNEIINTYDRKNFNGRPKFASFCSY